MAQLNVARSIGLVMSICCSVFAAGCQLVHLMDQDQQGWIRCGVYFGMPLLLGALAAVRWCKRFDATMVHDAELSRYLKYNADNKFERAGEQLVIRQCSYHAVRRALEMGNFNPDSNKQLRAIKLHDCSNTVLDRATMQMLFNPAGHGLVQGKIRLKQLRLKANWRSEELFIGLDLTLPNQPNACCLPSRKVHAHGLQIGNITNFGISASMPDSLTSKLVLQMLEQNSEVQVLKCSKNQISTSVGVQLAQLLQTSKGALTQLDLSSNFLADAAGIVLADSLRKNHGLKMINLSGNMLGEASGRAFGTAIATSGLSMTQLLLHHNADAERPSLSGALLAAFLQPGTRALRVKPFKHLKQSQIAFQVNIFFVQSSRPSLALTVDTLGDAGALALFDAVREPQSELESVTIEQCALGPASSVAIQKACLVGSSLKQLSLKQCSGLKFSGSWFSASEPPPELRSSVGSTHPLALFDIRGCQILAGDGVQLGALIHQLENLTCLNLSDCQLGDKEGTHVVKSLEGLASLARLELRGNQLGNQAQRELTDTLRSNSTLQILDLSNNQIEDSPVESNAQYLCSITQLNLSHNALLGVGVRQLAAALQHCGQNLTNLQLNSNQIQDGDAAKLLRALSTLQLQYLDLEDNLLSGESSEALVEFLRQGTCLQHLYLGNNQLGEVAAELFDALPYAKGLQTLSLASNCIKAAVSSELSQAIAQMDTLTHLDLSSNALGHVGGCCLAYGVSSAHHPAYSSAAHYKLTFAFLCFCISKPQCVILLDQFVIHSTHSCCCFVIHCDS